MGKRKRFLNSKNRAIKRKDRMALERSGRDRLRTIREASRGGGDPGAWDCLRKVGGGRGSRHVRRDAVGERDQLKKNKTKSA